MWAATACIEKDCGSSSGELQKIVTNLPQRLNHVLWVEETRQTICRRTFSACNKWRRWWAITHGNTALNRQRNGENRGPTLILPRSIPSASFRKRAHSSCARMNSLSTWEQSGISSGGATALGARKRIFGGGSASHMRRRPLGPSGNGGWPKILSRLPRSMPLAMSRCTVAAVMLRWAKHSAIDHLPGSGRRVICSGVRSRTRSWARRRISVNSSSNGRSRVATAVSPPAFVAPALLPVLLTFRMIPCTGKSACATQSSQITRSRSAG